MSQTTIGKAPCSRGAPLQDQERAALKTLVDSVGEREVLRRLGLKRHTLARALGGLGLYPPTLFMIRQRLAEVVGKHAAEEALAPQSNPSR